MRGGGARAAALAALEGWLGRRGHTKQLLVAQPALRRLPVRERALALELTHGVVRQLRTLRHLLRQLAGRPLERLERRALVSCLLGLYQLFYLERIPAHAAVHATVQLAGGRRRRGFVNAVLRRAARLLGPAHPAPPPGLAAERLLPVRADRWRELGEPLLPDWRSGSPAALGVAYSYPDALVARWLRSFGRQRAERLLLAGNQPPPLFLRVNRLRCTREQLLVELAESGIGARAWEPLPHAVLLPHGTEPGALPALVAGRCSVQDATAQELTLLVEPVPGERIADLCAAPGGKACYLAELMDDRGEVLACDRDPARLRHLEQAVRRLGLACVRLHAGDVTTAAGRPAGPFDRVLVDAPCSNTGVLRRRPEARWRFREQALVELAALQLQLLETAAALVRPGGLVVYSTCSLEEEENRGVAMAFLARHPDWRPAGETLRLPEPDGPDGGYGVKLLAPAAVQPGDGPAATA
ncbi:MAG: ribosomal RNA small subunit methyltransferase B [Planctomycetota bacterium]|nr:MAG: ribosomal RNA small subunit methyltransferase B [Planctomycetota bacterium]